MGFPLSYYKINCSVVAYLNKTNIRETFLYVHILLGKQSVDIFEIIPDTILCAKFCLKQYAIFISCRNKLYIYLF